MVGVQLHRLLIVSALLSCQVGAAPAKGQEPGSDSRAPASSEFSWRSLVGEQLWTDVLVYGEWRIQRHELRERYRLLDERNQERTSGTERKCRDEFARLRHSGVIPRLTGPAVITLHGFGRSRGHMESLGRRLEADSRFAWINVNYASTRGTIDDHAATLAGVISQLDGLDELHFVCHSLGNLVVRRYLHEASTQEPRWQTDPRIRRMVMLGPPNQGAKAAELIADLFEQNFWARVLTGPSAWQLAREWDDARQRLATPEFEFGILAGGHADLRGMNPLLPGDDDFVVRVVETQLVGACDFRLVDCRHGAMMRNPQIQKYTLHFLEHGCFTRADEQQPIPPRAAARADE